MDLIDRLKSTARGVEKRVVGVAKAAPVDAVASYAQDTFVRTTHLAGNAVKAVEHLPETAETWKLVLGAIKSGEHTKLPGHMPAYPTLDPTQLAAAVAAGKGQQVAQPFLGNQDGSDISEPVTINVTATKEELVRALERQGWTRNHGRTVKNYVRQGLAVLTHYDKVSDAPVSKQYLNGKLEDMAFSKNCDYNLGRDHMRIYQTGTDAATGKPTWAIAATRDLAATVTFHHPDRHGSVLPWKWDFEAPGFGHAADHAIDGERDLIMQDLLASGLVKDFKAVAGVRKGQDSPLPGGLIDASGYTTDGRVYQVTL